MSIYIWSISVGLKISLAGVNDDELILVRHFNALTMSLSKKNKAKVLP